MIKRQTERRTPIDWTLVHQRIEQSISAMDLATRPSGERTEQVLQERARKLARVTETEAVHGEQLLVIAFTVAGERYAIETRYVHEVVRFARCAPVPGVPEILVGLMNLRGELVAVFDIREVFGLARGPIASSARVLVLGDDRAAFGILVDDIEHTASVSAQALIDPSESVVGIARQCIRGVTDDALIVLHGDALLSDNRFFIDLPDGEQ